MRSLALVLVAVLAVCLRAPLSAQVAIELTEVAEVVFTGNETIPEYTLSRAIRTRPTECVSAVLQPFCWMGFDFARDPSFFSRRAFGEDKDRVRALYVFEGFREVEVDTATTTREDGRLRVEFRIQEGRPTLIGSVDLRGGEQEGLTASFGELSLEPGDRLSGRALDAARQALLEVAGGLGYAQAEVLRDLFIPNNDPYTAEVGFDVYPGRRYRIGEIRIDQTATLEEDVVRRALGFASGDSFNPNALADAQRALYSLEIVNFASVDTLANLEADSLLDVRVGLVEGDLRKVRTGGGWSTAECFNSEASWTNRNLFGGARRLQVRTRLSNIGAESLRSSVCPQAGTGDFGRLNWLLSADFVQPWSFSPRASFSASVFAERQSLQDVFVRQSVGVTLGITRRVGRAGTFTVSYSPQLSKMEAAEIFFCTSVLVCDPEQAAVLQDFNWLAPVDLAFSQDRRDQVLNPRDGYFWVVSFGHASSATGSEFRYERVGAEIAGYATLNETVFATRVKSGWLNEGEFRGFGANGGAVNVVPPQVRLFAGGANSVRGFPQNRLGPRVLTVPVETLVSDRTDGPAACTPEEIASLGCNGSPLDDRHFAVRPTGGSLLLEASLEARRSLGPPQFEGAVFLDVGQVWEEPSDFSFRDFEFAPGIGLRYFTPIGPLRIDLGYRFRGEDALRVVTSQVRPFDAAVDDPGDRLPGPGGSILEWVRTSELAPLSPLVAFGKPDFWSFRRLQLHFSIGQAY